jgi:hypothetical protein
MGVVRLPLGCVPLGLLVLAAGVEAKEPSPFVRPLLEAEIDWSAGTITAEAGAAADIRMPGPNAARPGAERRAQAAAEGKLRKALRELLPGKKLDDKTVLAQAARSRIEYQSNGGVVLWLSVRFADLIPAKPAALPLRVTSMPFSVAPQVTAGGKTAPVAFATYRPAGECPKHALPVQRDGEGRLVLPGAATQSLDSLAGAAVVIYLEKPQP